MTYVDSPGFELTFATFMRTISLSKAYAPGQVDKLFYFFDDILTISQIPNTIDTFIWCILLCIFDFFMIYISCPFGLFDNLSTNIEDSSSDYLYSNVTIQRISFIGIAITLLLIGYYWISFILYKPQIQFLTEFKATILYFIVFYVPLLLIPFCGVLFGSLITINLEKDFSQSSITGISFVLSLIALALLITASLFVVITKYSLTMRNGQFAFWEPPFSLVDYFILFLTSMFFPFRMTYEPRSATVISVIQFLYGIHYLLKLRNITFISIVPLTIQIKISIDVIIFPIFTVINVWVPSSKIIIYSIFILISYVSTCLSLFVLLILFKNSSSKIANFSSSNLPLSKASISMIRFAINLSMTDVTRPEIIKAISLWRFSFDLVPDIVRYCIITQQSLKDYMIPYRSYSSVFIAPLQFLAFQFDIYENHSSKDGSPRIEAKKEELNMLLNQSKVILDNFWTDPSFDQMDIYALGCEIKKITNKFASAIEYYPHSKEISKLWNDYINEIVYSELPSQLKRNNPYELLYNPNTTVYGYLNQHEIEKPIPTEKKESSVDWYFKQITKNSTIPLIAFYVVFFCAFLIIDIFLNVHSINMTDSRLNHIINTSDFLRLQAELANEKLAFIEPYIAMPTYHEIVELLGIDEESANYYTLTHVSSRSELADLISLYTFVNEIPLPSNSGNCKDIPLFILLKYNIPEGSSADLNYCRMLYISFYSRYITRISDDIIWSYNDENKIGKISVGVFISIFIGISSLLFAIFLWNDARNQKKMIFTVKSISKFFKQCRNLKTKSYNISINITYSIILWIFLMALSSLLYVVCEIPTNKENEKVIRLLLQISLISKISTAAQDSLSFIEGHQINQFDIPNIADYLTNSRENLINFVDQLLEVGIDSIFQNIPPLDKWIINGSNSFSSILLDFSQLLSNTTTPSEFRFFYARYLYLFNISVLIELTLPEMISKAQVEIQNTTFIFFIFSFLIAIAVLICMILNYFLYSRKLTWYYATTTYLRRIVLKDGSSFQIIRKMLSNPKENHLEELPYPFIIFDKQTGIILYSNSKVSDYVDYTMNQIVGQRIRSVFKIDNNICTVNINNKSSILQFHFDQIDHKYETVTITDITDVYEINQTYKEMINLMRPNIGSLPIRDKMILIKIRYDQKSNQNSNKLLMQTHVTKYNTQTSIPIINNNNNDNQQVNANNLIRNSGSALLANNNNTGSDPEFLFNLFDEAENNFNDAIRISCGATFYSALIPKTAFEEFNQQNFLDFLSLLTEKTEHNFIAAIVYGMVSVLPLDDDETRAVVCGNTPNRANDCIIFGYKNRIYMDEILISNLIGNDIVENSELLNDTLIAISPKIPPKI